MPIEAAMIWNEPNNKSHWDPNLDPDWSIFADTVKLAGTAIARANPAATRVLGGMSPIDPLWVRRMEGHGALDAVDVLAVHGFPLDWNLWSIHDWPAKVAEIEAVTDKPVWVTEVGVGSFGAEEVQVFGVQKTAELLIGRVPRVYWYSLFDLPMEWGAADLLVQPLRSAGRMGRHHPPPRGGGVELLPPFLHGPDPPRRDA